MADELFDANNVIPASEDSSALEESTPESAVENDASTETTETTGAEPAEEKVFEEEKAEKAKPLDFDSLSEEDKILAIRELAKAENLPAFARDKILPSLKLFDGAIKESQTLKQQLKEFEAKTAELAGRQAVSEPELARLKQSEANLLGLQSIAAKPAQIRDTLKQLNPRVYNDFIVDTAWQALETPDGAPNIENLQKIVDKFSGYDPATPNAVRVQAKDVLQAVERLKADEEGDLAAELYDYKTPEEQKAFEKTRALERAAEQRESQAQATLLRTEGEYRERAIRETVVGLDTELRQRIDPLLEKFELQPKPGEPRDLALFKTQVTRQAIVNAITNAYATNPHLQQIRQAFEFLREPQGFDTTAVQQEMQGYMQTEAFKQTVNAGYAAMMEDVEKVAAQHARLFTYVAKGYEATQKERVSSARKVAGAANQAPLTKEDLDLTGLSPNEANDRLMRQITQQLRHKPTSSEIG